MDGTDDGQDFDEITFSFEASPTFPSQTIASPLGNIVVPAKAGFQYLWIQSTTYHDPATGFTSQVPHSAHLEELGRPST